MQGENDKSKAGGGGEVIGESVDHIICFCTAAE